jgi:N-acetyl-gamma-glutamylphosphate reductase
MIDRAFSSDPVVRQMLERHPHVASVDVGVHAGVDLEIGEWRRSVRIGDLSGACAGLVELMDNNPMVCADEVSIPGPAGTLALIALGPLAWAGLILERPTFLSSFPCTESEVDASLATVGWAHGATLHEEPQDLQGVLAATAMVEIASPEDWTDIDALYEERFGRSFFVRRDEDSPWDLEVVLGQPYAVYRLRYTQGEDRSLLTATVMADANGKCGAAQVVHAMNVMAGFEESLGVA